MDERRVSIGGFDVAPERATPTIPSLPLETLNSREILFELLGGKLIVCRFFLIEMFPICNDLYSHCQHTTDKTEQRSSTAAL